VFLAQFQYNSSHDVSTQRSLYLYPAALKWTVFICSSVSMGHTSYPIQTLWIQWKWRQLLGNEPGENDLIMIPEKTI